MNKRKGIRLSEDQMAEDQSIRIAGKADFKT
jgi:hypothetical protein